ncbi:MAG TPA: hypothetical protein VLE73_04420 [Candidatus Saccharimonadales bacterium]|nr:hypothetical protein [Candidatus Saccharimonadales bacterium]
MDLAGRIRDYYFGYLTQLPTEKQFHYAARLHAWYQDERATAVLHSLRPQYVPEFPADGVLREALENIVHNAPTTAVNGHELRAPYFTRYPSLRGIELALFRVRHWLAIYDIDARDALFNAVDEDKLTALEKKLLRDADALRMLSTYAINFIYLYERVMLRQDGKDAIKLKRLYKIGKGYNLKDDEELRLCLYFYTHCIIAESNFYEHKLPEFALPTYVKMLKRMQKIITKHYDRISLDNKLEFLVCCRLADFADKLTGRIEDECQQSVSEEGTFLIDRHNAHAKTATKMSFAASEHRNVLYIMSQTPFKPIGQDDEQ